MSADPQLLAELRSLARLVERPAPPKDWKWPGTSEQLVHLARRHHIQPTVYCALKRLPDAGPEESAACEQLATDYEANARRVLANAHLLEQLIQRFDQRNIRVRTLKGLPLARQLYASETERHCGDIDLLLEPPAILRDARDVMDELGLAPEFGDEPEHMARLREYVLESATFKSNTRASYSMNRSDSMCWLMGACCSN